MINSLILKEGSYKNFCRTDVKVTVTEIFSRKCTHQSLRWTVRTATDIKFPGSKREFQHSVNTNIQDAAQKRTIVRTAA
jgi:hypothetical protein